MTRISILLAAAGIVALGGRPTRALGQIIAGQAIEAVDGTPLVGLRVRLLRHGMYDAKPGVVDSTRTDDRGLFQFGAPAAGIYQLDFGPALHSISQGPIDTLAADTVLERRYAVPVVRRAEESPYFEFEVERPVGPVVGGAAPSYPPDLKASNIEGSVLASFVVDAAGRVEPGSFRVLRSTHPAFTAAVQAVLPRMRFAPAMIGGIKVRQRAQQPFEFRLTF